MRKQNLAEKASKELLTDLFGVAPSIGEKERVSTEILETGKDVYLLVKVDGKDYAKINVEGEVKKAPKADELRDEIKAENAFLFRCHSLGKIKTKPRGKMQSEILLEKEAALSELYAKWEADEKEILAKIEATPETRKADLKKLEERKKSISEKARAKKESLAKEITELEQFRGVVEISETAKKEVTNIYVETFLGRRRDISKVKYVAKGLAQEDDAIKMLSLIDGVDYKKNTERRINFELWLTGEIDLKTKTVVEIEGEKVEGVEIIDVKNRYDADSFFQTSDDEQKKTESDQLDGYFILYPEALKATIASCLVNNTDDAITREVYLKSLNYEEGEMPNADKVKVIKEQVFDEMNFRRLVDFIVGDISEDAEALDQFESFREIPLEMRVKKVSRLRDEAKIEGTKDFLLRSKEYAKAKYKL